MQERYALLPPIAIDKKETMDVGPMAELSTTCCVDKVKLRLGLLIRFILSPNSATDRPGEKSGRSYHGRSDRKQRHRPGQILFPVPRDRYRARFLPVRT